MAESVSMNVEMPRCFVELLEFIFGCPFDAIPDKMNHDIEEPRSQWVSPGAYMDMISYSPNLYVFNKEIKDYPMFYVRADIEDEITNVKLGSNHQESLKEFLNSVGVFDRIDFTFYDRRQQKLALRLYKTIHTEYIHSTMAWLVKRGMIIPVHTEEQQLTPLMAIDFLQERGHDEEVMRGLCDWMCATSDRVDQAIRYCHEHQANDILAEILHRHNEFKKQQKCGWFDTKEMTFRL